jgi:polysaccharide biosynthesis/export protein
MVTRTAFLWALSGVLTLSACAHSTGEYVWADTITTSPRTAEKDYVIAAGDVINVRVYREEALSGRVRVRADGKISLPFVNDAPAAGLTPSALSENLQKRLREFIVNPMVAVVVDESHPFEVFVVGEVVHPGRFVMDGSATVLQAIASAGGLGTYADKDRIFVVRQNPVPIRIRFRYRALTDMQGRAATFRLQTGDTVVVE